MLGVPAQLWNIDEIPEVVQKRAAPIYRGVTGCTLSLSARSFESLRG